MKSVMSYIGPAAVLSIGFAIGIGLTLKSVENAANKRDPAAANAKVFQLESLSNDEVKAQLKNKIKVHPTLEGVKNISFNGFSSAICKNYPVVEVELTAEGVMVAGEAPTMKVVQPCEAGQDPAEMASLRLPIGKLLEEKPRNAEFKFDGYTAVITTLNSADEWPRQWVLKRVEFKSSGTEITAKQVEFTRGPASITEDTPIVIEF